MELIVPSSSLMLPFIEYARYSTTSLAKGYSAEFDLAQRSYMKANDYNSLFLLLSCSGDEEKLG
jgi:hypothetical protein